MTDLKALRDRIAARARELEQAKDSCPPLPVPKHPRAPMVAGIAYEGDPVACPRCGVLSPIIITQYRRIEGQVAVLHCGCLPPSERATKQRIAVHDRGVWLSRITEWFERIST